MRWGGIHVVLRLIARHTHTTFPRNINGVAGPEVAFCGVTDFFGERDRTCLFDSAKCDPILSVIVLNIEPVENDGRDEPTLPEIPVVILTSSAAGEDTVKSYGLDADHYLQKPVERDEFIGFVQSIEKF